MKKLLLNSTIIFILVIFPLIPSYLHLYNQVSSPEIKLCYDNGNRKNINILKTNIKAIIVNIFTPKLVIFYLYKNLKLSPWPNSQHPRYH